MGVVYRKLKMWFPLNFDIHLAPQKIITIADREYIATLCNQFYDTTYCNYNSNAFEAIREQIADFLTQKSCWNAIKHTESWEQSCFMELKSIYAKKLPFSNTAQLKDSINYSELQHLIGLIHNMNITNDKETSRNTIKFFCKAAKIVSDYVDMYI
jgi:hypothetical protein